MGENKNCLWIKIVPFDCVLCPHSLPSGNVQPFWKHFTPLRCCYSHLSTHQYLSLSVRPFAPQSWNSEYRGTQSLERFSFPEIRLTRDGLMIDISCTHYKNLYEWYFLLTFRASLSFLQMRTPINRLCHVLLLWISFLCSMSYYRYSCTYS